MRFHLKKSGEPGLCLAIRKECPLGGEHFETLKEARKASEFLLSDDLKSLGGLSKKAPKKEVSETTSVKFGEFDHKIGDESFERSLFFCKSCGERFSHDDNFNELIGGESAVCSCGKGSKLGPDNLMVQRSSLWILDKANYSKEENFLYHITTNPNWSEDIKKDPSLQVHLGDLTTTQYRANDLYWSEDVKGPFYLHKIRLKPSEGAELYRTQDLNNRWDSLEKDDNLHVYPNQWENPGALSVMTTTKNFEVFEVSEPLPFSKAGL